jgi:hypothetical protein
LHFLSLSLYLSLSLCPRFGLLISLSNISLFLRISLFPLSFSISLSLSLFLYLSFSISLSLSLFLSFPTQFPSLSEFLSLSLTLECSIFSLLLSLRQFFCCLTPAYILSLSSSVSYSFFLTHSYHTSPLLLVFLTI